MVSSTVILKLGGSIITDKRSRKPKFRARTVLQLVRELSLVLRANPTLRVILLHGAGSFGHPLAFRFRLTDAPLTKKTLTGYARTTASMRELGNLIAAVCWREGLPVVPLQTSSYVTIRHRRLHLETPEILSTILDAGGIPLLGGDVTITDRKRTTIVSADDLAILFAQLFNVQTLWFATNVNGVFDHDGALKPALTRIEVRSLMRTSKPNHHRYDVTGGMLGKLSALLRLRNRTVTIFNGTKQGLLIRLGRGRRVGTTLSL